MASVFYRDDETEAQQMAIIRRDERAIWLEKNLTDMQRKERSDQEKVLRNDAARGLPSVFSALEG